MSRTDTITWIDKEHKTLFGINDNGYIKFFVSSFAMCDLDENDSLKIVGIDLI